MGKSNSTFKLLQNITYLTQVGLTIAIPLVLCIFGASWLQQKFDLGGWVVLVGIILGIGGAVSSLAEFIRFANRQANKNKKPRSGYNNR
ncbi:MAG: AtpZ/AtpI family protein [Oscillospiraceae bacterium]